MIKTITQYIKHHHKNYHHKSKPTGFWYTIIFIIIGIGSLIWLVVRSGKKPSRIQYPCQKFAAANSLTFLGWFGSILAGHFLFKKLNFSFKKVSVLLVITGLTLGGMKVWGIYKNKRLIQTAVGAGISRVVWIKDPAATFGKSWDGGYDGRANQPAVNIMMDRAILSLTGQSTIEAAWTKIFQDNNEKRGRGRIDYNYAAGEKIAVKLNWNNAPWSNYLNPVPEVTNALLRQLIDPAPNGKGITPNNIILYDATRTFPPEFNNQIPYAVQKDPSYPWGVSVPGGGQLTSLLNDGNATYLINMPLLRTHSTTDVGMTISLKNHLGSVSNPGGYHPTDAFNQTALLQTNNNGLIKNKTILAIDDGLYGFKYEGPGGNPGNCSGEGICPYPNSIFVSQDPIAMDSVIIDYMQYAVDSYFDSNAVRNLYSNAANPPYQLGNYATCGAAPNNACYSGKGIELVKCDPTCPNAPLPSPSSSPTPSPSSSPSPSPSPAFTIAQLKTLLLNWLGIDDSQYHPVDAKINSLDVSWIIKWLVP